ncbi:UDP-2,4-diacetamido-2,4,6-trideoxy-beta-L-altropyranose hydrolase [Piscinibacter sp. XHJ-5]|uniref:UDP-2,4-diacetamido-2,4, 6-trideoxy-beta-L-altropyranose hydrolase n=1 Tax=Piscinibacter sp. XHJ-5 TaxID=3037797 RepID=UPI002453711F|nr:UDP-2,4-diacetamido-2,4,6-trideoxy-beta-L-altropyranose hydrolase [Piscinibacter sp. XHJ-5]
MVGTLPRRVAFRVDGGTVIGSGHVVRCLALAHELRALGREVHFICRPHDGHLGAAIEAKGFRLHLLPAGDASVAAPEARWLGADWRQDADETARVLGGVRPEWLVVDHYGIDERWETVQAPHAARLLVIDDLANRPHRAEWLVDQNLQPRPDRYRDRVPAGCRLLLGPRHALLRKAFREQASRLPARDGAVRRMLACVGGADPQGVLPRILDAWQALGPERPALDIAVGAHSPKLALLRARCSALPGCTLHVDSEDIASLMAEADLLVCAAGTINWERCCLALPAVMTEIAANQRDNLRLLARQRTGVSIGRAEALAAADLAALLQRLLARPSLLKRMGQRCARLVDGLGAFRVAAAMSADDVALRPARESDGEAAWAWRNAESTRRYFTDPRPLPLARHLDWWHAAVADPRRSLLIAHLGATGIGVVRLDHEDDAATVSIYLDPALTGLGLGAPLLDAARRWTAERCTGPRRLRAVIDPRNHASRRAFAAAGFHEEGAHWVREARDD